MKRNQILIVLAALFGLFHIHVLAQSFSVVTDFAPPLSTISGNTPSAGLIQGPDGFLYGTSGGHENDGASPILGVIFKIQTNGSGYTVLKYFTKSADGDTPASRLVLAGNTLYGTTDYGGANHSGTIFKINADGSAFAVLHSFAPVMTNEFRLAFNADGGVPQAGLILSGGVLYGAAANGGLANAGTLFKINTNGSSFTVIHTFTNGLDGADPAGGLATDGILLYGTANSAGTNKNGTVFSLKPSGAGFKVLHAFNNNDGSQPQGDLLLSNGFLYGTTSSGTISNRGSVFSIAANGSNFSTLHMFIGSDGSAPTGGLALSMGVLYGATSLQGLGTLFSLSTNGNDFSNLFEFDPHNAATFTGDLLVNGSTLYGTTESGGTNAEGTVFSISSTGAGFSNLFQFQATPPASVGQGPDAPLIQSAQTLFGATASGGNFGNGTVFAVNTNRAGLTVLHNFSPLVNVTEPAKKTPAVIVTIVASNSDGVAPLAPLVQSGATLYGTASAGGSNGFGTIFKINNDGSAFSTLHSFTGADGANPSSSLLLVGNTLYGSTQSGGSNGDGALFAISTDGSAFKVLHNFTGDDGSGPQSALIIFSNMLYGTTAYGGDGFGTVFSITTNGTAFSILHDFEGNDGTHPFSSLLLSGNTLYGTTYGDGITNYGTVFSLNTNGAGYSSLYNFTGSNDGSYPSAGLILNGASLYGVASSGGVTNAGVLFSLYTNGTGFQPLYTFTNGYDGSSPEGSLLMTGRTLFGTAFAGGDLGYGTVFNLTLPPLYLTTQPAPVTVIAGGSASFSVTASVTNRLNYRWFSVINRVTNALPSQTNASLTLNNLTPGRAGGYYVAVTSASGNIVSETAPLTIYALPAITRQPANLSLVAGNNATFSAAATGTPPLSYQWTFSGNPIPAQTHSSFSLTNVQAANQGDYQCIVSNISGQITNSSSANGNLTVIADTSPPAVQITSPAPNTSLTTPQFVLTGTATDNGRITNVTVSRTFPPSALSTTNASLFAFTPGNQIWSNVLTLVDGSNTFTVQAADSAGNLSAPVSRTFFFVNPSPLTVNIQGTGSGGTVPIGSKAYGAAANGAFLQITRPYSIKAVADSFSVFANWSDISNNILTTNPVLTFVMTSNLVINANFTTNPIIAAGAVGSYYGLFYHDVFLVKPGGILVPAQAFEQSSGSVSSLNLHTNGTYGASITLAGSTYTLSGALSLLGGLTDTETVLRPGKSNLIVHLQLNGIFSPADAIHIFPDITGTVACPGENWNTPLTAYLAPFNANNPYPNPARYTMIIPPGPGSPESSPGGYGFGLFTNNASGIVTLAGKLADATPFSESAPISGGGYWPLYTSLYAGQGLLIGWLNFNFKTTGVPTGILTWIKPSSPPATNIPPTTYINGFTNIVEVQSSYYNLGNPAIALASNTLEIIDGDGLGLPLQFNVQVGINNTIQRLSPLPTNGLTGSINPVTGKLTLTFRPTGLGGTNDRTASGAVLQNSNIGFGSFIASTNSLGQSNTGAILLY